MKSIAFANRLARDLDANGFTALDADARLEILDAINGGLQTIHALAPHESKTTVASLYLAPPAALTLGVTQGSAAITGHEFTADQLYCTIRLDGDGIDNQVISQTELLHPYAGPTGTVSATVHADAVIVPEPYDELVGNPWILETRRELQSIAPGALQMGYWGDHARQRDIGEPRFYHLEPNARNQNPPAPSVIRFDTLPETSYRMQARFTIAPARVAFADLLSPESSELPMRSEYIEAYLLPVCRGLLSTSLLWKSPDSRTTATTYANEAKARYSELVPRTLSTPRNTARTKAGF
jgi:hypothetical protein